MARAAARRGHSSVEETTIAADSRGDAPRRLTCRALVDAYLRRIDAYDKNGPRINAIVIVNPTRAEQADELDRRFAQSGPVGPLHCIPTIVKDNFETIGLQSAAGSLVAQGLRLRTRTRSRSSASRRPARSCSPSRTWRSSRSAPTRR